MKRGALAREPDAIALVWVTGGFTMVGAALALALVRPRGPAIVRRAVGLAGWIVGIGLVLYAVANFVQHVVGSRLTAGRCALIAAARRDSISSRNLDVAQTAR